MTESILAQSLKAKKNGFFGFFKRKSVLAALAVLLVGGGVWYYFHRDTTTDTAAAVQKEWTVKKDDLQIAIDSDGKVVAEDGVELSFSVSGDTLEVKDVYVKEGDEVKKGDKIAAVKTSDLEYDLTKAYASYQSALADYNEKLAGATDSEKNNAKSSIEQAQLNLNQAKISLDKVKISAQDKITAAEEAVTDAKENLDKNASADTSEDVADAYANVVDTVKAVSLLLNNVLPQSDKILGVDDESINDSFESNLGAENIATLATAKKTYQVAKKSQEALDDSASFLSVNSGNAKIDAAVVQANTAMNQMQEHLYAMQKMLDASVVSSSFSQSALDSFKSTISANRSSVNAKLSSLKSDQDALADAKDKIGDYQEIYDDAVKALADAKTEAAQDIADSESSLAAKELSLRNAQQGYSDVVAPLTESELASARSALTSATISLDKARSDLDKAVMTSPIDGKVASLNYKAGDIILTSDTDPFVEIINNNTLFIEVNIEEADINKLKVGQKAQATFDALDGMELEGEISFISMTSDTNNNGVVTYQVRVLFEKPDTADVLEGMTASVNFIISGVTNVLQVPVAAVRNVNDKPSVQLKGGDWVVVTTGYTDGKYVEVISGVNEGDVVMY